MSPQERARAKRKAAEQPSKLVPRPDYTEAKIEKQPPPRRITTSVFDDLSEVAERFEREVRAGSADAPRMRKK